MTVAASKLKHEAHYKSHFLVLLSGAIVFVTEAGIAQRSARWDAYMSQPRHKRATSAWQGGGERASCTLQGLTSRDTTTTCLWTPLSSPEPRGMWQLLGICTCTYLH